MFRRSGRRFADKNMRQTMNLTRRYCGASPAPLLIPHAKAPAEGILVVAGTAMRRQHLELLDVAAADHGVVGLEGRDQALHDVGNVDAPLLLAMAFQSGLADVILVGVLSVGQMTELHGLDDALDDHGGAEPGAETEKEHLAALIAAQGLHRGIVDKLHGMVECAGEIEADPA